MRSLRTLLPAIVLAVAALVATGCGGSEVAPEEVPGAPAALTVPSDDDLGGGGGGGGDADAANGEGDADAEADADGDGTTDSTTPEATATAVPDDTSGGAAAPEATPEDTAANDTPPAGAEAEQFESFCEQNAGAC
jgi:hypothetical protein